MINLPALKVLSRGFRLLLTTVCCALLLAGPAVASFTWDEDGEGGGDAGQSISGAQRVQGVGDLEYITGRNPGAPKPFGIGGFLAGTDIDLYRIGITDPSTFSADMLTAPPNVTPTLHDAGLFLFDTNGRGILHNQDAAGPPPVGQALIPAGLPQITSLTPGDYVIGVAPFAGANIAQAQTSLGSMFLSPPPGFSVGPQNDRPLIGWTTGLPIKNYDQSYVVSFTGAGPAAIPEPGAWMLCCVPLAFIGGRWLARRWGFSV